MFRQSIFILSLALMSFASNAMTAIYTGSPFTQGNTQWGALTLKVEFSDDFTPVMGRWSGRDDVVSVRASTTSGVIYPDLPGRFTEFQFDPNGQIQSWWVYLFSGGSYPNSASFSSYRNGSDGGPASWDSVILPGVGNSASTYVATGVWQQSSPLIPLPSPVPEPAQAALLLSGLVAIALAIRSGRKRIAVG